MKAYREARDIPISRRIKAGAGSIFRMLQPKKAEEVKAEPFSREWGHRARLIRNAHQRDAVAGRDHETLHRFLCDYWKAPVSAVAEFVWLNSALEMAGC